MADSEVVRKCPNKGNFPGSFEVNGVKIMDRNVICNEINKYYVNLGKALARSTKHMGVKDLLKGLRII